MSSPGATECQSSAGHDKPNANETPPRSFPKQEGNAWGVKVNSHTEDFNRHNSSGTVILERLDDTKSTSLANIMAEQEFDSELRKKDDTTHPRVKFTQEIEGEEERMMRLAIVASLRDQNNEWQNTVSALKNANAYSKSFEAGHGHSIDKTLLQLTSDNDHLDEDMMTAISLSLQDSGVVAGSQLKPGCDADRDKKPLAIGVERSDENLKSSFHADGFISSGNETFAHVGSDAINDDSEILARKLYNSELHRIKSYQSASAAAEAASLQYAMMLQLDESRSHLNNDTARSKKADGLGVQTVSREKFHKMRNEGIRDSDGRIMQRRKQEEKSMGVLLRSRQHYDDSCTPHFEPSCSETQGIEEESCLEEYEEEGIRMNPQIGRGCVSQEKKSRNGWHRVDKDSFVGPNNEIRTKHDPELGKSANAMKLKGAYDHNSTQVSDRAYNSFVRAEARQTGMKKGVTNQGHGRAENMNAGKTRGGAMDGAVRLQIASAINAGLIDKCNGVVKEGKEALVYHAESGWRGRDTCYLTCGKLDSNDPDAVSSDGYDVAVKVFKRISEFKGRGAYVDGDPRFHKQKFKSSDQREQIVIWAEKEYRNLIRASRAGVRVPRPLRLRENVLFMRFLGEDGWPSPQLREVEIKDGSDKWTVLYCETIVAIRRLYHCARLVHADLSEYNLLLCPSWQLSESQKKSPHEDQLLRLVMIDFGQAVERGHPAALELLRRDLETVTQFFVKQGIKTLRIEDVEKFVLAPCSGFVPINIVTSCDDPEYTKDKVEASLWRHSVPGWDDEKDMAELLAKLNDVE